MRIAELSQVRGFYPQVPAGAVEHLLWALHRVRPLVESGDTDTALNQLRADLAAYRGPVEDLAGLGVLHLFRGLERGRHAFAGALGGQGLLATEPGSLTRYVVVGPLLDVRLWARQRGIGQNAVLPMVRATDVYKLRGLGGRGIAIVRLLERRGDPELEQALTALIEGGAITLPPRWTPGNVAEGGEPRLTLRPASPAGPATA